MVNIELTPKQAEELKNFYIVELEKIQKRSVEVKELLSKLNSQTVLIKTSGTKKIVAKIAATLMMLFVFIISGVVFILLWF